MRRVGFALPRTSHCKKLHIRGDLYLLIQIFTGKNNFISLIHLPVTHPPLDFPNQKILTFRFIILKKGIEADVDVPLDITANELVLALSSAYLKLKLYIPKK